MIKDKINEPQLEDVINGAIDDLAYTLNCHRVGIIESFDPVNQNATIKLVDKGVYEYTENETIIDYPPLLEVPVLIHKATDGGITIPIIKGDTCLVVFNDRDLDNWLLNGLIQRPNTLRKHDLSDAIAIIGIKNQKNKIADYNNLATVINYKNNKITIDDAEINLLNSVGNGNIIIDDKIDIKNAAENLKALITDFINIVKNLKTVDPDSGNIPIDPSTSSALTALSNRVGNLLK
jgi:hypothetical protein